MCGIIGVFGRKDAEKLVKEGLKIIKNRDGKDLKIIEKEKFSIMKYEDFRLKVKGDFEDLDHSDIFLF